MNCHLLNACHCARYSSNSLHELLHFFYHNFFEADGITLISQRQGPGAQVTPVC